MTVLIVRIQENSDGGPGNFRIDTDNTRREDATEQEIKVANILEDTIFNKAEKIMHNVSTIFNIKNEQV